MNPFFLPYGAGATRRLIGLIDAGALADNEHAAETLYSRFGRQLNSTDLLIARVQPWFNATALSNNGDFGPIIRRARRANVRILTYGEGAHHLGDNISSAPYVDLNVAPEVLLRWLASEELKHLAISTSAIFPVGQNLLYRSPSGTYFRTFLRVGNIQHSSYAIDAVAFWLLPHFAEATAVLTDSWSISSTALNLVRLRGDTWRNGEGGRCQIESLPTYFDSRQRTFDACCEVLRRFPIDGDLRLLVLVSAVSTGNSIGRLVRALDAVGIAREQYKTVALYGLAAAGHVETICSLTELKDAEALPLFEPVATKPHRQTVIEIDPRTYFPNRLVENVLSVKKAAGKPGFEFFSAYAGRRAFRVHSDALEGNGQIRRHHAFDIDVCSMLTTQRFQGALTATLTKLPEAPGLLVSPDHVAGRALAQFAQNYIAERFGQGPRKGTILHPSLLPDDSNRVADVVAGLRSDEWIWIIDDVSVSGSRLGGYQANLRGMGFSGHIAFVIGVARPTESEEWERRVNHLTYPLPGGGSNIVECVEQVILPDWGVEACPWCHEREDLRRILAVGSLPPGARRIATKRAIRLTTAKDGLVEDVFWRVNPRHEPVLQNRSFFLDHIGTESEADLVLAVASALERMRHNVGRNWLGTRFPMVNVIDPRDYLGPTDYSESSLRRAFIRSATGPELAVFGLSRRERRDEMFRAIVLSGSADAESESTRLEFAAAALGGRLPLPTLTPAELRILRKTAAGRMMADISKSLID